MNKCISVNKMSLMVVLSSCLLLSVTSPASAFEMRQCVANGSKMPSAERSAQMHACLSQASSPANVKAVALQYKKLSCIQNAKNKALSGTEKTIYLETCINKNQAQEVYAALNDQKKRISLATNN